MIRKRKGSIMKATWNNQVIAEANNDELIRIEGNWYFPQSALKKEFYEQSDHRTTCVWKGEANYYDVVVNDERNEFGAWFYPEPKDGSIERVGKDYTSYVAFWNGVTVEA
jgi:uncharacterized protein (DUF427 family)